MKNSVKIVRFWSRIECSRILEKNLEFENSNNCFISTEMVCFFFFNMKLPEVRIQTFISMI
jgi:hypothetical protein